MQPATLKLKPRDFKSRLTLLGVVNLVNSDIVDQIDPLGLSNWEDQVSKSIANVLYRAEEKNYQKRVSTNWVCKKGSTKI